jgi:hypothetical protein
MSHEWNDGARYEERHPAVDEVDGLDLLIPAPRLSPENVGVK